MGLGLPRRSGAATAMCWRWRVAPGGRQAVQASWCISPAPWAAASTSHVCRSQASTESARSRVEDRSQSAELPKRNGGHRALGIRPGGAGNRTDRVDRGSVSPPAGGKWMKWASVALRSGLPSELCLGREHGYSRRMLPIACAGLRHPPLGGRRPPLAGNRPQSCAASFSAAGRRPRLAGACYS